MRKTDQKSYHNKSVNTFMLPIAVINPIKQPGFVLQTVIKGVNAVSVTGMYQLLARNHCPQPPEVYNCVVKPPSRGLAAKPRLSKTHLTHILSMP